MQSIEAMVDKPLTQAEDAVRQALTERGFGVLTEIDVAATLRDKLGVHRPGLKILGACNPTLAHRVLSLDPSAALLLPCNVVLEELGHDRTKVTVADPRTLLANLSEGAQRAELEELAAGAATVLEEAVATLESRSAVAAQWDRRYGATDRLFRPDPDETLVELASPLAPATALDLGAGEGRNSLWLARRGWKVTAVDASEVALGRLEAAAADSGLAIETAAEDVFDFLGAARARHQRYDLVVVAYVHPATDGRARLVEAAAEAVSPGGHLFVVAHHRDSLGRAGPPDPERLYVEDDFTGLSPGLEVARLERRPGSSDVEDHGVDVLVWAQRPPS
jgi:uncharacterized protein (DUF302 family)/SAM-dependent methyltransferase